MSIAFLPKQGRPSVRGEPFVLPLRTKGEQRKDQDRLVEPYATWTNGPSKDPTLSRFLMNLELRASGLYKQLDRKR
ncbi:MAG: hypothetical protein BZY81_01790 [SAR202 cluster bacterium Io17-Chloro-G4]|nr:MAG: hypothetical protein BZY81_01790 [SAR202 cluster bacterium Io17-Chloro-G4]